MSDINNVSIKVLNTLKQHSKELGVFNDPNIEQLKKLLQNKDESNDSEILSVIEKIVSSKLSPKFKESKNLQIQARDAAWVTYSMNRQIGRGRLLSWLLATTTLVQFFYLKVFRRANIKNLNERIARSLMKPGWTIIKHFLIRFLAILPAILSALAVSASLYSSSNSIVAIGRASDLWGSGIPQFGIISAAVKIIAIFLWIIAQYSLLRRIKKRNNSDTNVVSHNY